MSEYNSLSMCARPRRPEHVLELELHVAHEAYR
jgi:hypothetical protein